MKHNVQGGFIRIVKFVFHNRRIIGTFIGTTLMFVGYSKEADFIRELSSIQ